MLRWVVVAAVLTGSGPAAAEDWYALNLLGAAPERQIGMIDAASVDRGDPRRTVFKSGILYEKPFDSGANLIVATNRIDCAARTIEIIYIEGFDPEGRPIASEPYTETPRAIAPSTTAESERIAVCDAQLEANGRALGARTMGSIAEEFFGS